MKYNRESVVGSEVLYKTIDTRIEFLTALRNLTNYLLFEVRSVFQKQALTAPSGEVCIRCTIGRLRYSQEASHIDLSEIRQTTKELSMRFFCDHNKPYNINLTYLN